MHYAYRTEYVKDEQEIVVVQIFGIHDFSRGGIGSRHANSVTDSISIIIVNNALPHKFRIMISQNCDMRYNLEIGFGKRFTRECEAMIAIDTAERDVE